MDPVELLRAAEARRAAHPPNFQLDAYRLVNGPGDGAPAGLSVDRYGAWRLISARQSLSARALEPWVEALAADESVRGVGLARLDKDRLQSEARLVHGEAPGGPVAMREGAARLWVRLFDGPHTGLFLDHRDSRRWVYESSEGLEVLNLFAYTGAFSVQAALGGAARVTSVDVSKRALSWARDNMTASGLDPDTQRWFSDDVLALLRRGSGAYDLVIADPPVFGRAKGRSFSLRRDLDALLGGCLRQLRPGGRLLFSTHALWLTQEALLVRAERQAAALGLALSLEWSAGLPSWDHPSAPAASGADRGAYLKTLLLKRS